MNSIVRSLSVIQVKPLEFGSISKTIERYQRRVKELRINHKRDADSQYQLLCEETEKFKEELSGMGAMVVASSSSTLTSSEVNMDGNDNMEVETGLFSGPPEPRQSKKINLQMNMFRFIYTDQNLVGSMDMLERIPWPLSRSRANSTAILPSVLENETSSLERVGIMHTLTEASTIN
ncbi:hypothetical protein Bca101_054414 [Brassica carinata]